MKRTYHASTLFYLSLLASACGGRPTTATPSLTPPIAATRDHSFTNHGVTRNDPYFWMRDDDRNDPDVLAYLNAENAYTDAVFAPQHDFQENLYQELVARVPQTDQGVAVRDGEFLYYRRMLPQKEHPVFCRAPVGRCTDADSCAPHENCYLDANERSSSHSYYSIGDVVISASGSLLAISEDTVSRRQYAIRVKNLETGAFLEDVIENTSGEIVFDAVGSHIFYVKKDPTTLREFQVWRHQLGTPASDDVKVFEETDEEFAVSIGQSRSEEYVLIQSHQTETSEVLVIPSAEPTAAAQVLLAREVGHDYSADHAHGRFYFLSNWQAPDNRIFSAPLADSHDKNRWREELPAETGVRVEGFEVFANHLVTQERRDGHLGLRIYPWASTTPGQVDRGQGRTLEQDESSGVAYLSAQNSFGDSILRFAYTSLTTPNTVYELDLQNGTRALKKRQIVGGNFRQEDYVSESLEVVARDGTRVPVSLVHRRDLDRSRPQPLLLYAYGSYGYSMDPSFSASRISLLDRGFIFAIAHVRGGQERGRAWYDNGKLLNKLNTFYDFVDVGRHFVQTHVTSEGLLSAHGGSAGGLLMGAVANMAPELFRGGIVADVPFVDVVTTMLDATIPLTTFEYDEWGNPEEQQYFEYMMRYSPYDNVVAQDYPPMLVLTGLHDSQVQYWEPAKWVARLRATKTGTSPLLFSVNMDAGHGGASGRFQALRETAMVYTFLLHQQNRAH